MNLSLAQEEIDKENDYFVVRKPMGCHGNNESNHDNGKINHEEDEENDEEKILLIQQKRQKAAEAAAQAQAASFSNKIDADFVRREVHHVV